MFPSSNKDVVEYFEQLEKWCQHMIIKKKELWFHNNVSDYDIEEMMNPIIRSYKSGKYFLVRCYIKGNNCNVYNEDQQIVSLDSLSEVDQIIPLITLEGIKFSSKSIQIEINLTQIMVLIPSHEIEKHCLIKINKNNKKEETLVNSDNIIDKSRKQELKVLNNENIEKNQEENLNLDNDKVEDRVDDGVDDQADDGVNDRVDDREDDRVDKKFQDINISPNLDNNENILEEFIVDISEPNDSADKIALKDPNEVYKEIYVAAKKKAKELRKNALTAYLEAKNIKKKYYLEELDDSDSNDEEIEILLKK